MHTLEKSFKETVMSSNNIIVGIKVNLIAT